MVIKIDEINFPDENFREVLIKYFGDSVETDIVEELNLFCCEINTLKGIEHFTNLEILYCSHNNITELNVEYFTKLRHLDCSNNKITKLILDNNFKLEDVHCEGNGLVELILKGCVNLQTLICYYNKFKVLPLGNLPELIELTVDDTLEDNMDISKCINLMIENVHFENKKRSKL